LRTSAGIFDFEILMFLFSAGGRATLFEIASSIFSDRYAYAAGDGYLTWNAVGQEAIDAALPGILDGARAMALLNVARSARLGRRAAPNYALPLLRTTFVGPRPWPICGWRALGLSDECPVPPSAEGPPTVKGRSS
jgi:hypothetical protein